MMYRLIILSGPLQGQQVSVGPQPMTLGRAAECELVIPDAELAGRHAVLEQRRGGLFILDLGTMNRLLVNRREVRAAKLKHGDTVELGRTRFLVQALVQAEVEAAPARRRPWHRWLPALGLAGGLLLALLWGGVRMRSAGRASPPPPRPEARRPGSPVGASAPGPLETPPAAEDVRRLREELSLIREAVRQLAATTQAPPARLVAPAPAAPPRLPRAAQPALRLLALEQNRLPDRPEFDEMRLLHITLAPAAAPLPETAAIHIQVAFFDADEYTGARSPTAALTLQTELTPPAAWNRQDPVVLTASCVVPHGLRDRQLLAGRKMRFAGYRVRVYADRELHAEEARPQALLGEE
ncbi:MAG: FHA domain-containing protein [Kiritimatiellaeota bacterium]|nr:FHA domain-containing protein [Kiritimatiellota bacterium]